MKGFFICLLISLFTLVSCIEENEEVITIGYSVMNLANPYFSSVIKGVEDRASTLDIEVIIRDASSNPQLQHNQVIEFIEQGVDVIVVSPVDPRVAEELVRLCHEAGVPFINPHQRVKGNDANINLLDFDYGFAGGSIAGNWISNELGGEAEVLILGYPQMEALVDRAQGIRAGLLAAAPGAKIVAEVSANIPEEGYTAVMEVLKNNPDIKVICGTNDAGALGAMDGVIALGLNQPDFCVVGLDATNEAIARMKQENSIFRGTVDIDPYGTGKLIVDISLTVLERGPIGEMVKIPMIPVTIDNLDHY